MASTDSSFDFPASLGNGGFSIEQLKGIQKVLKYFQDQAVTIAAITSGTIAGLTSLASAVISATTSLAVGASGTAITQIRVYSQSLDVASVAANTTAEQTFTVTGLATGDKVFVNKPSASAGLGIVNARVSATNTLALTFVNATGTPIDPAAETYTIVAIRS